MLGDRHGHDPVMDALWIFPTHPRECVFLGSLGWPLGFPDIEIIQELAFNVDRSKLVSGTFVLPSDTDDHRLPFRRVPEASVVPVFIKSLVEGLHHPSRGSVGVE